ncbi:MAG: hypothetical protein CM1200mP13_06740 [Candidatus Pelagibacterales bacterium]|nr:MAG: hypothetical protein CM1200mP13_06740 [Pelagibacterales bacterium]
MSKDVVAFLAWAAEPHLGKLDTRLVLEQLFIC